MPKIPDCDRCQLYSFTPNQVCTIYPTGPDSDSCLDFAPTAGAIAEELPEPVAASYYAGEPIPDIQSRLSREEQLGLLETHPLFTGRCPQCKNEVNNHNHPPCEWQCDRCGWSDPC